MARSALVLISALALGSVAMIQPSSQLLTPIPAREGWTNLSDPSHGIVEAPVFLRTPFLGADTDNGIVTGEFDYEEPELPGVNSSNIFEFVDPYFRTSIYDGHRMTWKPDPRAALSWDAQAPTDSTIAGEVYFNPWVGAFPL